MAQSFSVPSVETIKVDLNEKPIWLLSSYAPGRDPPTQLIDGKDVSFEEMRLLAYQCQATGTPASYVLQP
jgi:nucleoporin NUP42